MQNLGKITKYLPFLHNENVKRHVPVVRPNAFSCPGNARKWRRIYAFRLEQEGNARKDEQSGAGKSRLSGLLEAICPDFLQTAKWLTSREVGS